MGTARSRLRIVLGAAALGALVATGTACAGSLEDPDRFLTDAGADLEGSIATSPDGGCLDVPTQLFARVCAASGCHSSATKNQGLDLQSPNVASRLVGVGAKGGGLLVDPAHPAQSVVYTKVTSMPPYGLRMPLGEPALPETTVRCVLEWVTAQGDGGVL